MIRRISSMCRYVSKSLGEEEAVIAMGKIVDSALKNKLDLSKF
jgi:hypothetical protein